MFIQIAETTRNSCYNIECGECFDNDNLRPEKYFFSIFLSTT